MNFEIKGVHYVVDDETKEYIEKKLQKVDYAKDMIVDLLLAIRHEKNRFKLETNINFRWGYASHIKVNSFDLREGLDKLLDKIESKINKEKDKIQSHPKETH